MELKNLLKTTPKYVSLLERNGIKTVKDFLQYFPRTYEDRSNLRTLDQLVFNEKGVTTTKGKITVKKVFSRGGKRIYDIQFIDENWQKGYISIFNSWFLASKIEEEKRYIIIGKPTFRFGKLIFSHPEVIQTTWPEIGNETEQEETTNTSQSIIGVGRIYPIYSELNGIKSNRFVQKIWSIIDKVDEVFTEYLPKEFLEKYNLLGVQETIKQIHFPDNGELQRRALQRIFFDRLLRVQLYSLINRHQYQNGKIGENREELPNRDIVKTIISKLPFQLTNAQKKVIKHIIENIHDPKPMMRLLQWDVGSGKTVVAAIGAYYTHISNKGQSVFLAPLEVLANQHHKTLAKLLLPLGLRVELITWSLSKAQKDKIKEDLLDGKIHVLIGTHAILQEDVNFKQLGFVVIDEQHKFWVKQRAFFKKFNSPDILQMSATPIPRSMALAFFGEFDVSIIDELPAGRKPITTKIISESEYLKLKPRILSKINEGQKVFIVTPLIEESEKMEELKAATGEYMDAQLLYPEIKNKIGLLHGKMKPKEKEETMQKFKSGQYCLLVSTTVIEVGVDIPDATIMVIKNSERFWLSQLHQLRWRIGRSDLQSYCFLETKKKSGDTYNRLKAMEETTDGFKLAELDLKNRWAGEILGTQQSGDTDIPLEILSNIKFLEDVQDWAKRLLEKYPNLEWLDALKKYLQEKIGDILA